MDLDKFNFSVEDVRIHRENLARAEKWCRERALHADGTAVFGPGPLAVHSLRCAHRILSVITKIFSLQINWDEYIGHYILGARHYLLKEKPESLPQARVLLRRLYLLDKLVSMLFYGLLFWLIYSYWNDIVYSFEAISDTTSDFINQRFLRNKVESI